MWWLKVTYESNVSQSLEVVKLIIISGTLEISHWRYFGTPRLTKAASIIPGGEGNIAGDALEYATD